MSMVMIMIVGVMVMVKRGPSIRVDLGMVAAGVRMFVVVVSMMKMAVMGMALILMGKIRVRVLFPGSLNPFDEHNRANQEDDYTRSETEPWIKRFGQNEAGGIQGNQSKREHAKRVGQRYGGAQKGSVFQSSATSHQVSRHYRFTVAR